MTRSYRSGLERLLADPTLRRPWRQAHRPVAHPASVTRDLTTHSLDALAALFADLKLTAAFGPQHGLRGDKQDNMVESPDLSRPPPRHPGVQPLRRSAPPADRGDAVHFDVLLVDLQDLGCRITPSSPRCATYSKPPHGMAKAVWVLDRPNPAGRPVEGLLLRDGWESFVGAGPLPMRHGSTMGELARWFIATLKLDVDCDVVTMDGWQPDAAPGSAGRSVSAAG